MDRQRAEMFLELGKRGSIIGKTDKGGTIQFYRETPGSIKEIEQMSNKKLTTLWRQYIAMIDFENRFSIADIQRVTLFEMEMESRGVTKEQFDKMYAEIEKAYEEH